MGNKIDRRAVIGIGLLIIVLIAIIVAIIIGKHSYKPSKKAEKTTKAEATSEVTTEEPKELTIEEKMAKFEKEYLENRGDKGEDKTPPVLVATDYSTAEKGATQIPGPTFAVDDRDKSVTLTYEGEYDLNKLGDYPLVRVATDSSGNVTKKAFTLRVVEKKEKKEETVVKMDPYPLANAISKWKTDKTQIGIDVSKWQGDINWEKVKAGGVEFVMMRLGVQDGFRGERYVDRKFIQNFKGAQAAGLPVGVYFYSCATCAEDGAEDAKFVHKTLTENGFVPDLPIAFDWEEWGNITIAKMSLGDLNDSFKMFSGVLQAAGYKTCLYQSKSYLANGFWYDQDKYDIWLAQYYKEPTYEGKFFMWQFSATGVVPGIAGDCDLDLMYLS